MGKTGITIKGLAELRQDLKQFPLIKQAQILRNANRKAAKKIVVKRLLDSNPHTRRKFGKRSKKRPFGRDWRKPFIVHNEKGSKTAVRAGIASAFFHYRFAEFGTAKRRTRKKGLSRGVMKKTRPFIEKTLDNSISPLFKYLQTDYKKELNKVITRLKNKAKK